MTNLPDTIPLFALPNLVLFPSVNVPLHIFENRYRQMIAEAAEYDDMIGMMLLKGTWEQDYYSHPDVYEIGCAGRLIAREKLADGRFNVILRGESEFRCVREMRDRPYRRAQVEWRPPRSQALELDAEAMSTLYEFLVRYLGPGAEAAWRMTVVDRGLRDAALVNFLCFHLDIAPLEKQALLEALNDRLPCLFDVLSFKIEERKFGYLGSRGGNSGTVQ